MIDQIRGEDLTIGTVLCINGQPARISGLDIDGTVEIWIDTPIPFGPPDITAQLDEHLPTYLKAARPTTSKLADHVH